MTIQESATPPPAAAPRSTTHTAGGAYAIVGLLTGLGAVVASSCCAVPLALASLGAGAGIFGALEILAPWRIPLLVASGIGVGLAWRAWWHGRSPSCEPGTACAERPRSRIALPLLLLATAMVVAAADWNYIELPLLNLVRSS